MNPPRSIALAVVNAGHWSAMGCPPGDSGETAEFHRTYPIESYTVPDFRRALRLIPLSDSRMARDCASCRACASSIAAASLGEARRSIQSMGKPVVRRTNVRLSEYPGTFAGAVIHWSPCSQFTVEVASGSDDAS